LRHQKLNFRKQKYMTMIHFSDFFRNLYDCF
jgi:hypothetical protein